MRAGPYKGRSHTARSTFSFFITVFNDGKEHYHFYVEYNYSFKSRKMLKNVVGVHVCVSDACVCVSLYLFVSVCCKTEWYQAALALFLLQGEG